MKLYFDTNLYCFISAYGEASEVCQLLMTGGHIMQATSENLLKTYAISDDAALRSEVSTLVAVASSIELHPQS